MGQRYYFSGTRPGQDGKRASAFLAMVGDEEGMRRQWAKMNAEIPHVHRQAHSLPIADVTCDTPMVYFMRAHRGAVKIGYTASRAGLSMRLINIQIGSPVPVRIVGAVPGTRADEHRAHLLLRHHRSSGEWFGPSPEVTAFVAMALEAGAIPLS